tara:strand:+ start:31193 stop:33409 length:2217 start_codon:yes stop_codon:yes gene_type:complete
MSIWAAFGAQLPKSYETARRTRLDTLNAFNTFKKNNPYATGEEFQQFIDTASGGSNYLRGGLPGKEIIAAIDKENADNRDRRAMERYVTQAKQGGELDGIFASQLDQAVLNMNPGSTEDDWNNAFNSFLETIPEGTGRDVYGRRAQPRFNEGYRGKLVTGQIRDNLQDAMTFMKSSAGSDVTAADLATNFQLPLDVATGLHARVNEVYGQEQNLLQQQNFEAAIAAGVNIIKNTPDIDAAELSAQLQKRFDGLDAKFAGDFFPKVAADALERERIAKNDRDRTILTNARRTAKDVKDGMRDNPITQSSIIGNDKKGWTANYLSEMEENLSDEEFKIFYGVEKGELDVSKFYDEWDSLVEISRAAQREAQQTRRTAVSSASVQAAQSYREANNDRQDDLFAWAKDTGKGVETILSQSYDMNNTFAQAAADMTNKLLLNGGEDNPPTPQDIVQQIRGNAEIMGLTVPINEAAVNHGQQMAQVNGAFDVITADQYFTGFQAEVTEKFGKAEEYVASVMASDLPLESKRTLLAQVQSEINQFATTSMSNHVQRQRRQDRWVEHGTGGYDAERHSAVGEEIEGMNVAIGGFIADAQLKVIEQIKAQEDNPTVPTEVSQVATPLFNETLAKVVENQGSLEGHERAAVALKTMNQLKIDLRLAAWVGRKDTNKDTWEQFTMVEKYLNYPLVKGGFLGKDTTVQDKISLDVNEYMKFISDPIAYMLADEEFIDNHPGYAELLGEGN